jgi:hypothetical protein
LTLNLGLGAHAGRLTGWAAALLLTGTAGCEGVCEGNRVRDASKAPASSHLSLLNITNPLQPNAVWAVPYRNPLALSKPVYLARPTTPLQQAVISTKKLAELHRTQDHMVGREWDEHQRCPSRVLHSWPSWAGAGLWETDPCSLWPSHPSAWQPLPAQLTLQESLEISADLTASPAEFMTNSDHDPPVVLPGVR